MASLQSGAFTATITFNGQSINTIIGELILNSGIDIPKVDKRKYNKGIDFYRRNKNE